MKRYISFLLSAVMIMLMLPIASEASGQKFTSIQIAAAAQSIVQEIEANKVIPETVTVASAPITSAQYLNLAVKAIVNISNSDASDIELIDSQEAPDSRENIKSGTLTKSDYITLARNISNFIDRSDAKRAPNFATCALGEMGYENMVYVFSNVLQGYNSDKKLTDSIYVLPWSEFISPEYIPTPSPKATLEPTPSIQLDRSRFLTTAVRIKSSIEINKKLPTYVTAGVYRLYMPDLLYSMLAFVANAGKGDVIYHSALKPEKAGESFNTGTLTRSEYSFIANEAMKYIEASSMAPSYIVCDLGSISFHSLIYIYAGIISAYRTNGVFPAEVSITQWSKVTGATLPTPAPTKSYTPAPKPTSTPAASASPTKAPARETVSAAYISNAALRLISSVSASKKLPTYITLGTARSTLPDFLILLMRYVMYIGSGIEAKVPLQRVDIPQFAGEKFSGGSIEKSEYIELARQGIDFAQSTGLAPSYLNTSLGAVSFQASVYFYSKIVEYYRVNKVLPESIQISTWQSLTGVSLPTPSLTFAPTPMPTLTPYSGVGAMPGDDYETGGVGYNGAVSSSSKYASKIGIDILKAGGNAVDAAVATIFAVGLCEPSGSSIGGGGLSVIYLAEQNKYVVMDYMVAGTDSGTTGIPGIVKGAAEMLEKYGTMSLQEVLAPVIALARSGFAVTNTFCKKSKLVGSTDGTYLYSLYRNNGEYFQTGDVFKNEDLADVLQMIYDGGVDAFYNSEFTDTLCEYMRQNGCSMTREQFAQYEVIERQPKTGTYRGYNLYAGSGSAQGGANVISMLSKMNAYDMSILNHDSTEAVSITASAWGLRPTSGSIGIKDIISEEELSFDTDWFDTKSTTMLVTRDKYGNMVASNNTLGDNFGSKVAMPGTGFCFSSRNCALGSRVSSTMAPTIVAYHNGTPMLGVGSPGNSAIITATAITISNILDFGMNVSQAINAPRIYGGGSTITIENRYSQATLDGLRDMGYTLYANDSFSDGVGCVSAIYVDEDGRVYSAADIRREYMSYAY